MLGERVEDEHSRILYRLIHVCSTCDSDHHSAAAGATAVSYHACSGEGVALRRVSEAVAALARTEVEAAARAPESSVAVLCLQATESSRVCSARWGSQSATSATRGTVVDPTAGTVGGWGGGGGVGFFTGTMETEEGPAKLGSKRDGGWLRSGRW